MSLPPATLAVFAILGIGCGFGSYPDKDGSYSKQFPTTPLSNQVCQVDEDCVATAYRDGSCCPDSCAATLNIYNRETFDRLQAHQAEICADGEFDCLKKNCKPLTYTQEARCVDGHCTIIKTDPEPTGKQKAAKAKAAKAKAPKQKGGKRKPGKRKVQKRP